MTTTFDGLRDIIVRDFELPAERLRRDTALEEIELDSLAITELVFALEDEFHVTAGNVNPAFKNLGDIADYIDTLIAERDGAPKAAGGAAKPRAAVTKPARAPAGKSAAPRAAKSTPGKPAAALRTPGAKTARGAGNGTKAAAGGRGAVNGSAHTNGGKPPAPAPGDARPRKGKRSSATASGARTR
jgi:acyl carrier protein